MRPAPAAAANNFVYKCGKIQIQLGLAKKNGEVIGTDVSFEVKVRGKENEADPVRVTGGTIVFRSIDEPVAFYLKGKKYECKLLDPSLLSSED